ncbi:MAG: hypothetical protein KDA60_12595 [Planctomycetales bacterium]|nr:hypothetical protein [Planctomycetales bacterium]
MKTGAKSDQVGQEQHPETQPPYQRARFAQNAENTGFVGTHGVTDVGTVAIGVELFDFARSVESAIVGSLRSLLRALRIRRCEANKTILVFPIWIN